MSAERRSNKPEKCPFCGKDAWDGPGALRISDPANANGVLAHETCLDPREYGYANNDEGNPMDPDIGDR